MIKWNNRRRKVWLFEKCENCSSSPKWLCFNRLCGICTLMWLKKGINGLFTGFNFTLSRFHFIINVIYWNIAQFLKVCILGSNYAIFCFILLFVKDKSFFICVHIKAGNSGHIKLDHEWVWSRMTPYGRIRMLSVLF